MEKKDIRNRQISYKVWIKDLIKGNYIKREGWEPNYIETKDGKTISRVNIIGIVISKSDSGLNYHDITLDDGSESIPIRSFEEKDIFSDIGIGNILMIIGRPRKYGEVIYIVPEIIKKIKDPKWIELRKLELRKQGLATGKAEEDIVEKVNAKDVIAEEGIPKDSEEVGPEKVYKLIKELDSGSGADIEELIKKSEIKDCEKIIKKFLEEGDIFEVTHGKVKVLE